MAVIQDEIGDKGFLRRNEHEIGEPAKIIALEGSNGDRTHLRVLCHGVEHDVPWYQWIPNKPGMYVVNSKDNVSKLAEIKRYDEATDTVDIELLIEHVILKFVSKLWF